MPRSRIQEVGLGCSLVQLVLTLAASCETGVSISDLALVLEKFLVSSGQYVS